MQSLQPIFVGGTGRSGSTVTGYLLGSHPAIRATTPREIRFLTDRGGLLDVALGSKGRPGPSVHASPGKVSGARRLVGHALNKKPVNDFASSSAFLRNMYGPWWERESPEGEPRGLHRGIDAADLHAALQRFDATIGKDRRGASTTLLHELLDEQARVVGAQAWAETTPQNAENAHRIVELLPQAKVIFMIRDGRDTAASVLQKQWGPDSAMNALAWWYQGAKRAMRSMAALGPEQGLTVRLCKLINTDRQESLQRLFDFVGYDVDPAVQEYFDTRMSRGRAHVARWRRGIPTDKVGAFETRYAEMWEELTTMGLDLPPLEFQMGD